MQPLAAAYGRTRTADLSGLWRLRFSTHRNGWDQLRNTDTAEFQGARGKVACIDLRCENGSYH